MANRKIAAVFTRARDFLSRYSVLDPDDLNIATVWAIGTWTFSPMCQWPATYPYLYVTGPASSGKTVFTQDSMGAICRQHTSATGATGSTLFRMLGIYDEETGQVQNLAPTLYLDEIDTTYSGSKDPDLTRAMDVGYKRGATIPRAAGKTFMAFPVYGPKLLAGIDNGHLPPPLLSRCIRIEMVKRTQDELTAAGIEPFFIFDVEEEAAELQQQLSDWAKDQSMVLRDYRPTPPAGLAARQWEISRSLVQLAHVIGNEDQIVKSLATIFNRNPERPSHKVQLYRSIFDLFAELNEDRLTSAQILKRLAQDGVNVPGNSGKGLSAVLSEDGVSPTYIRFKPDHSGVADLDSKVQRGYFRHVFDGPFVRYLEDE